MAFGCLKVGLGESLTEVRVSGSGLSRRGLQLCIFGAALGAIIYFSWFYGFGLLRADAPFWVNPANDMTVMLGGYEALLHAPWRFPPTVVNSLTGAPVSIVYTDSLPWLSLALKASGIGASVNPLALFLLISYPLQALGMIALLRALGVERPVALLAGAAMALCFPPWIGRQFGHIALSGHWVVLFALALSVSSARRRLTPGRVAAFALLAAVATGVHAYHLVPVGACFGAALLSELLQRRPGSLPRCGLAALAVLGGVLASAAVLGYGAGLGRTGGAGDLGAYAMNLLGPVLPVGSRLFGQVWNGYWFTRIIDPTGAQSFEGLQYLGAGGLLLVALAGLGALQACARLEWRPAIARWGPLALAMLALAIWAVGWNVYFGDVLVTRIPKPSGRVAEVLGAFRAHGRFFWAPGYLLLAMGVAWASRFPPKIATPLLMAAVALQAWDSGPLRQAARQTYRPVPSAVPTSLRDASWIVGRKWVFAPTVFCSPVMADRRVIAEYDLLIMRSGGQSNSYATARDNDPPCGQSPARSPLDAAPGDDAITVVPTGRGIFTPELQQVAWRGDCFETAHAVLCGRGLTALRGVTPLARGDLAAAPGPTIYQAHMAHGDLADLLTTGWWVADLSGAGVWSSARKATISLPVPLSSVPAGGLVIDFSALAYSEPPLRPQRAAVFVNRRPSANLEVGSGSFRTYRLLVSREVVRLRKPLEIVFELPDARAPKTDPRLLGVALQSVVVRANAAEKPRVAAAEAGQARVQ
jgi:hypothetical protein